MRSINIRVALLVVSLFLAPAVFAQSPDSANQGGASSAAAAEVPRLIKFSGTLLDAQDHPMAGPVGVTFALHAQQTGGTALWIETQNVTPDAHGNYTVLLGANSTNGVPAELFASGEARWLEVQVERQTEQPRILLVSVPYALKAKDAETLGGRPASAYLTAETLTNAGNSSAATATAASSTLLKSSTATTPKKAASTPQFAACSGLTSNGTATINSIGLFTTACNIQSSVITQSGSNVGIGTAAPAVALDIVGNNAGLRLSGTGTHQVTVTGASSGRLGQDLTGFFFSSDTNGKGIKFLTNNGSLNEWMRITSAGNVGIGTTTPAAKLDVNGNQNITGNLSVSGVLSLPLSTSPTAGVININGLPFVNTFGSFNFFLGGLAGNFTTTGNTNTGLGFAALAGNTSGSQNIAVGQNALLNNTTGGNNTASGVGALQSNTSGSNNTAVGLGVLQNNNANGNTASGAAALRNNTTGSSNTASGVNALNSNTTGARNTAFGEAALFSNTTASDNIALGYHAGLNATTGGSNIYIGHAGVAVEGNTIRIGDGSTQTAAFITGISGATSASGIAVLVNSSGQLGTTTSSRRYKEQIADLGAESDVLMKLRPVAFFYKPELDSTHTRQYGLVAEEVAQIAPSLVVFDKDGAPQTVRYHFVNAMLLNEVQKQHGQIEAQGRQIQTQQEQLQEITALKQENAQLRQQLLAISDQVKQMHNQMEAASAKPENAAKDSGSRASALVSEASARKSQALR